MLPAPGALVGGKYRVIRLIGEGGMGAVFEAVHEHLGSRVALKFLHPDLAQRPALVARFLQEARVSAAIRNPHVTQVVDVDQTPEGEAYLVMELLEGESLEARLGKGSPMPVADAVDIGLQVLSALEAAHGIGVVHRDLKPDNVWLQPSGSGPWVKLLDFGIAKLKTSNEFQQVSTRPGSMMGTPAYMAPEQAISADQVDGRADLYSLGVILYEMLSGARPVDGEEPQEILERLMRGEVHPLATRSKQVPPGLATLVDRLVAPNPDERPSNAATARAALAQYGRPSFGDREGNRPSGFVPKTLPPDDTSAPPFVTAEQRVPFITAVQHGGSQSPHSQAPAARPSTAAMPRAADLAHATTELATSPGRPSAPAPAPARRSRAGAWMVGLFLMAAAAGGGVWVYMNPSVLGDDTLPPLPGPVPSAATRPIPAIDAGVEFAGVTKSREPARRPGTSATQPVGTPQATPLPTTPAIPTLPFPPFTIPSGILQIPSTLPQFFPQIPGITAPASASAQPSGTARPE